MTKNDFDAAFKALTDNPPFPWQQALFARFLDGDIPASCNLPTGLGKTSVIAIWLLALAIAPAKIPRRLVYVVNRRTVVDQTTNEVEKIVDRIATFPEHVRGLTVSTLRGQFADNREWSADPSRPAVICGTVDMIGSRLLFSGYGVGFKGKPLHAGFLGQDAQLVHDEAHLEPAFQELIETIEKEQRDGEQTGDLPWPKLRVMELTATPRSTGEVFPNEKERSANEKHAEVLKRVTAKKTIVLHPIADPKKLAELITELLLTPALKDSRRPILVFVQRVDDVEKIVAKLKKNGQKVQQLTGTLRGKERDELVKDSIFVRFLPKAAKVDETVYLVCTSAGEVGVNISADHLVCDLSTFESMAQRFGRVNRFGIHTDTHIHIFHPTAFEAKDDYAARLEKTLALMQRLNGDGSPKALGELPLSDRVAAFAPKPTILPATDILFDAWALTTIRDRLPGRPPVEPYLHGLEDDNKAETSVAWREEVWELRREFETDDERERFQQYAADLLDDYPLKPHELLRDSTYRKNSGVREKMAKLADGQANLPVWLVGLQGDVQVMTLGQAADQMLVSRTVILPPEAGGLLIDSGISRGLFDGDARLGPDVRRCYDVADEWKDENDAPRRVRVWDPTPNDSRVPPDARLIRKIDTKPEAEDSDEEEAASRRFWHWFELPQSADGDGSKSSRKPVLWDVHTADVVKNASELVANLPLPEDIKQAVTIAARFHDLGKRRPLFQKILGNLDETKLLAKSGKKGGYVREQYRHEFGSLIDVLDEKEFRELQDQPELQDLVLHLIAVHHGYGRPHFPPDLAFDPEPKGKDLAQIAAEVPRRFARLQRKYGRWGLAYLESLLRAADWAASAAPSREEES